MNAQAVQGARRADGGRVMTYMRCPVDGRFMRRLAPTGRWWMCSRGCRELRCSDYEVEFGWQLMQGRKLIRT